MVSDYTDPRNRNSKPEKVRTRPSLQLLLAKCAGANTTKWYTHNFEDTLLQARPCNQFMLVANEAMDTSNELTDMVTKRPDRLTPNQPSRFHKIRQNSQRESVSHDLNASAPVDTRAGVGEGGGSHGCQSKYAHVQHCPYLFLPLQVGHVLKANYWVV